MEFTENKKIDSAEKATTDNFSKSEIELGYEFAKHMRKEFSDFIKAIVLFGSSSKNKNSHKSDIDILVVIDDLSVDITAEIVESYRIITEKIISKVSNKLHITSLRYVTFWKYVRDANPVAVSILRDGLPIIDTNFIVPLQQLLRRGEIKPSAESIINYFARSTDSLHSVKSSLLQACVGLYWSVTDAVHSLLMMYNVVSPSPEDIPEHMHSHLLSRNVLTKNHIETFKEFFTLSKLINHNELKHMSGKDFDEYYAKAYAFVNDIKKELEKMK